MSIVKCEYNFRLNITENPQLDFPTAANPNVIHRISDGSADTDNGEAELYLDTTTTPDCTMVWGDDLSLSGGALTIDLTDLDRGNISPNLDMTGLKVRFLKLHVNSTATSPVKFTKGASTGYDLGYDGTTNASIILEAGNIAMFYFGTVLEDVAAGVKNIDVSSTDVDANFDILIGAGN